MVTKTLESSITILQKVARVIKLYSFETTAEERLLSIETFMAKHADRIATRAISTAFQAAADDGWHMHPGEATDEMINAGVDARAAFFRKTGFSDSGPRIVLVANHPAGTIYQAMLGAAPEFEWDK